MTGQSHLEAAIAELHAARLYLQGAILAVCRAVDAGEPTADGNLRVIDAEFRGTTEEAAVLAVLLDQILTARTVEESPHGPAERRLRDGVRASSARRRAATSPAGTARR